VTDETGAKADEAAPPPRKKKRKKRKPGEEASGRDARPAGETSASAGGDDRPLFARDFPSDAELDRLVAAFEAGNYALVRSGANQLVHATKNEAVRRSARQLLTRIEPDRTAVLLLGVAVALLLFVSWWHWTHPHGAGG
jgi:hypothetical protein